MGPSLSRSPGLLTGPWVWLRSRLWGAELLRLIIRVHIRLYSHAGAYEGAAAFLGKCRFLGILVPDMCYFVLQF